MKTFQDIIQILQNFWTQNGCILQQSYDTETGAGTFNPDTFLRCLGPEPYNVCNVEISKRPTDGRYGQNPNRLQKFHQFQVILKPSPEKFQEMYLQSLEAIGFSLKDHDIRFVHDDWESPTQGAWGLGWEVWCDGMEVTQFTYFQCVGGVELKPIAVELAYGLERIAMFLQGVDNVYKVQYNDTLTYGDVFLQNEIESCYYNFEDADIEMWKRHFEDFEREGKRLIDLGRAHTAYDFAIKSSHAFNMLTARNAISTTMRVNLMHRIRDLACKAAEKYLENRESLGFPLLKYAKKEEVVPDCPLQEKSPFFKKSDDFLLEIGSEELPAAFIPGALLELEKNIKELLDANTLSYSEIKVYGTPRRLTVYVTDLISSLDNQVTLKKGPSLEIAFDEEGNLTKQGQGFFQSVGEKPLTLSALKEGKSNIISLKEETYLFAEIKKPRKETLQILQEALPKLISHLHFPKKMRWGNFSISYARPLRWILALFGKEVIPFVLANIVSDRYSYGHRQVDPRPIKIRHPRKYLAKLRRRKVLVCIAERKAHIEKQLDKLARKAHAKVVERDIILSEVIHLSEFPILAIHKFNEKFLSLPKELLVSEMSIHQRLFPLVDKEGKIMNLFIVAVDKKPTELILRNNEAVLTARLTDGLFLFEQDQKQSLEHFNAQLKTIVFHKELGSIFDKVTRIKMLTEELANLLQEKAPLRAAELCKFDLATNVVYEFPDLQGIIGKYYARLKNEPEEVAKSIEEHWWPLTEGSSIPTTPQSSILALADKLDNLISYTRIGIKASSSKDPYALRRASIGVLRILIENKWSLDLRKLIDNEELLQFIQQRMKGVLADHDFKKEEIETVLTRATFDPYDIYLRVKALNTFRRNSNTFEKFQEVYKRAKGQIEGQSEKHFDHALIKEDAEKKLSRILDEITPSFEKAIGSRDYLSAFEALSKLADPMNEFFTHVRVLVEDNSLKENRIALLQKIFHQTKELL